MSGPCFFKCFQEAQILKGVANRDSLGRANLVALNAKNADPVPPRGALVENSSPSRVPNCEPLAPKSDAPKPKTLPTKNYSGAKLSAPGRQTALTPPKMPVLLSENTIFGDLKLFGKIRRTDP